MGVMEPLALGSIVWEAGMSFGSGAPIWGALCSILMMTTILLPIRFRDCRRA